MAPTSSASQAIVIQPMCMAYEFFLLKLVQREHMKRFSIILALPSATIRAMASRQLQVGDEHLLWKCLVERKDSLTSYKKPSLRRQLGMVLTSAHDNLQVDDDSKADADDDENLEALAGVQVAQGQAGGIGEDVPEKKSQKEQKNVRITADPRDDGENAWRTSNISF